MKKFFTRLFCTLGFFVFLGIAGMMIIFLTDVFKEDPIPQSAVLVLDTNDDFPEISKENALHQFFSHKPVTSFFHLLYALSAAEADPRIKGIALRVDSHAMGLAQLQELREALMNFRKSGKFIRAYAHSFGDLSPGTSLYYLASCADRIWMQPISTLTLTGLHVDTPFFGKFIQKWGVDPQILTRKEYKNAYAPLTDENASAANTEAMTLLLNRFYDTLMLDIAAGREFDGPTFQETLRTQPIFTDREALKNNLIDTLGYIDQFKEEALKAATPKDPQAPPAKLLSIHTYAQDSLFGALPKAPRIALIYAVGPIQSKEDTAGFMGQGPTVGAEETRHAFEEVLKDPTVKAIVLRIDSPGGSGVASETIRRQVLIAQEKGIPVVASLGNVAASGGYWIASPCQKILASPLTITGSIGVIAGKVVFKRLLESQDINISAFAAGHNGEMTSPLSPYTPANLAVLNHSMDAWYAHFIRIVAAGRKLSEDHVGEIAKGRVWSGIDAKQFGLVDDFGGLRHAFRKARELAGIKDDDLYDIVEYPKSKGVLERLEQSFSSKSDLSMMLTSIRIFMQDLRLQLSGQPMLYANVPHVK